MQVSLLSLKWWGFVMIKLLFSACPAHRRRRSLDASLGRDLRSLAPKHPCHRLHGTLGEWALPDTSLLLPFTRLLKQALFYIYIVMPCQYWLRILIKVGSTFYHLFMCHNLGKVRRDLFKNFIFPSLIITSRPSIWIISGCICCPAQTWSFRNLVHPGEDTSVS